MTGSISFIPAVRWTAGRELAAYFDSTIAYVYTIAFTLLANAIFMNEFFLTGNVDMSPFFEVLPWLLVFFLPAITMRLWAEEKKTRTLELLLTLPIRPVQAVLGKYLAALGLFAVFLAGTLPIPVMLLILGDPDVGLILSGYVGLFLMGGFFLAVGMCLSALTADQIVAFVLTVVAGFAFVLTGHDRVVSVMDGLFSGLSMGTFLYENFSVLPHYEALVRGVVPLGSVLYFGLLSAAFLWLNAWNLQQRRS